MSGFSLLWEKILNSSLWITESKETRLVWITVLAMKDRTGRIFASRVGLADRAKVTIDECEAALAALTSPDANDTSGVEGGRRLREIPGGWEVVNHELYQFSSEHKRELARLRKQKQRRAVVASVAPCGGSATSARERAYTEADAAGDERAKDRLSGTGGDIL